MPHDPERNVLFLAESRGRIATGTGLPVGEVERLLTDATATLARARAERQPVPTIDRTRYVSWSAMMAGALLGAAPLLREPWARDHGLATVRWLMAMGPDGRLPHRPGGIGGLLEDQVHAADLALDGFEATGDDSLLRWAESVMEVVWQEYWDQEEGGFFDLARGREADGLLGTRLKPIQDAPVPSPNGTAGVVLARLHAHTGTALWRERQEAAVAAFAGRAAGLGLFGAAWLQAADWLLNPVSHLVVTGAADDPVAEALHREALAAPLPRRVVRRLRPGQPADPLPAELRAMLAAGDAPLGYLCIGTRCLAPVADPDRWAEMFREAQGRSRQ
jgi:uncharacterized protein YyaL (SSP411 family)